LFSLKSDVNEPPVSNKLVILKSTEKKEDPRSGSLIQRYQYGSADPELYQNVTDPELSTARYLNVSCMLPGSI
jgi:hypothetical protein